MPGSKRPKILAIKLSEMNSDVMTFNANQLHQRLNDLTYSYPIRWNKLKKYWTNTKSIRTKLSSYYMLPCGCKAVLIFLFFIQCIWLANHNEKYPAHYFPFTFIEFTGFGMCLAVDWFCYTHGEALTLATNWSYEKGGIWLKEHLVFGTTYLLIYTSFLKLFQ